MTVDFPLERVGRRGAEPDLAQLQNVIAESAELLEASLTSDDPELREGAVELALRTLRVTERVLARAMPEPVGGPGSVLAGPWESLPLPDGPG